MLTHATRDLGNRKVDTFVHVLGLGRGVEDDVIGAEEDDLGLVPTASFNVEDRFRLDDAGVIQVNATDLLHGILPE